MPRDVGYLSCRSRCWNRTGARRLRSRALLRSRRAEARPYRHRRIGRQHRGAEAPDARPASRSPGQPPDHHARSFRAPQPACRGARRRRGFPGPSRRERGGDRTGMRLCRHGRPAPSGGERRHRPGGGAAGEHGAARDRSDDAVGRPGLWLARGRRGALGHAQRRRVGPGGDQGGRRDHDRPAPPRRRSAGHAARGAGGDRRRPYRARRRAGGCDRRCRARRGRRLPPALRRPHLRGGDRGRIGDQLGQPSAVRPAGRAHLSGVPRRTVRGEGRQALAVPLPDRSRLFRRGFGGAP